jgi:hypothetical protein
MLEDNRRGRAGQSSRTLSTAGRSRGLRELTEAKELRRTLLLACFDARFSWCLSRRLRNRDMPFIVVVDEYDTHPECMRSMWPGGLSRGRQRAWCRRKVQTSPEPPRGWWGCQWAVVYWDGKRADCQPRTGDDVQQRDLQRVKGPTTVTWDGLNVQHLHQPQVANWSRSRQVRASGVALLASRGP